MEGIKNYTVTFFTGEKDLISGTTSHETKNVTAEQALALMQAVDMEKKQVIIGGELYKTHQINSITRNFEAEKDETYGKQLTDKQRNSLDTRYLKHGSLGIADKLKEIANKKQLPPIIGSVESPQ